MGVTHVKPLVWAVLDYYTQKNMRTYTVSAGSVWLPNAELVTLITFQLLRLGCKEPTSVWHIVSNKGTRVCVLSLYASSGTVPAHMPVNLSVWYFFDLWEKIRMTLLQLLLLAVTAQREGHAKLLAVWSTTNCDTGISVCVATHNYFP